MNDTKSTVERLKELSDQLKNGKISQDEFNTKKQEILHPSSVSSNSANDGDKHKNKKIQWITLVSIVTFLILLYPLFCLLPAHTQIKIMKGFYSRPGKQIIYSQTESHETAIMIYSDGKNIYYYDYKGHHEITPCLASGVYVFRPRLTYGADNLTYIDVAIENEGRGKVHPLFSSSCTYQYLQNHCLLVKTNNGAAYIIKFGEQGTNIYYAENFTIDEQDDEGVMRFTTYGKFDLDSIAQKRGWNQFGVKIEKYSDFYVDASFDTKSETIVEVYQVGGTNCNWKFLGNAMSKENIETIYSVTEYSICQQLQDKIMSLQDFVNNIRYKDKENYYFIEFYAEGIKKNKNETYIIYRNQFGFCDFYVHTEDAQLLELDYPCWVTIYAKYEYYDSGWFTPTLRMTEACLFDGHSLPQITI